MSHIEGITIRLAQLIDERLNRTGLLADAKLRSSAPAIKFLEDFAETSDEFDEYCGYFNIREKNSIHRDLQFEALRAKERRDREQQFESSGNAWELGGTRLDRRMRKIEPTKLAEFKRPYREQILRFWEEELEIFGFGDLKPTDAIKLSNIPLYRRLMASAADSMGFSFDDQLSKKNSPVFSKSFGESIRLAWLVNADYLNVARGEDIVISETGEHIPVGPALDLKMSIYNCTNEQAKRVAMWDSFVFLPVRLGPLGLTWTKFFNARQLAALVNINITAYSLLRREIEEAITDAQR